MDYQLRANERDVRVGVDGKEVAHFKKGWLPIYNLEGPYDGRNYQLKLAAPWTGMRHRLRQDDQELASAKRTKVSAHVFEAELDVGGRQLQMKSADDLGARYDLMDGNEIVGALTLREFDREAQWNHDLRIPDDWPAPVAAFIGWLATEWQRHGLD